MTVVINAFDDTWHMLVFQSKDIQIKVSKNGHVNMKEVSRAIDKAIVNVKDKIEKAQRSNDPHHPSPVHGK